MKLTQQQLHDHLKRTLQPLYLLSGDESLLVQEACDAIYQSAKKQGYTERETYQVGANFDWQQIQFSCQTLSLFAEKTLIEIRFLANKFSQDAKKALIALAEKPPEDKLIIVRFPKLETATPKTKWFKTIEQASVFIQYWPISSEQLPGWINARCQQVGITIDRQIAFLLIENCEGNLLALAQEIEKLSLLHPNAKITLEQASQAITDSARYDIFSLADNVLLGDSKHVLRMLKGLQEEGVEPILVLWSLAKELRLLSKIKLQLQQGQALPKLLQREGVWARRVPLVKKALNRFQDNKWLFLLTKANKIDQMLKTGTNALVWNAIESLALAMSGSYTHNI